MSTPKSTLRIAGLFASVLLVAGCGDAAFFDDSPSSSDPPAAESSASDDLSEVELSGATRRSPPASTVPESTGPAPIGVLAPEPNLRIVKNLVERRVPHTVYVHVHSGGGTSLQLHGIDPGEERSFTPAPKEQPALFVDRMEDRLESELVAAGLDSDRAETVVDRKSDELLRSHGERVLYVAPDQWTAATGHDALGAVPANAD